MSFMLYLVNYVELKYVFSKLESKMEILSYLSLYIIF